MPDVVLRPRRESCALTLGPAFVSVTDERGTARSFPRDGNRGAPGAASRLCARVTDGPPGLVPPEIRSLVLVDGRGAVLATLRWDGNDHESLETACATAGMPLDRRPVGGGPATGTGNPAPGVASGRPVRLLAPRQSSGSGRSGRSGSARGHRRGARIALVLGPREVAVTGVDQDRLRWPRLGCAPAETPAVARLRVTLFADRPANDPDLLPGPPPGRQRVLGLTLLTSDGQPLAYLWWVGGDLDTVRRACAAAGVQPEYRWQPDGDPDALRQPGVPVIHTGSPVPGGIPEPAVGRVVGQVPGRTMGGGPDRAATPAPADHRWLYPIAVLALVVLAVAVILLSVR